MDRLDLGILKMLLVNNGVPPPGNSVLRKSFRSMAKNLGVDQSTVRKRMKLLQEQRVLRGWYLGVNPGLAGQDVMYAWFTIEDESEKEGTIERLLSLPDLERVCSYFGSNLKMVLLCNKRTNTKSLKDQLVRLAGSRAVLRNHSFLEVPSFHLGETDRAIIRSLRRDPWKSSPTVARELGLSARTVKRRVERLSEDGRIYMLPILDYKALRGVVPADLIVGYVSTESRSTANERIEAFVKEVLMFSGGFGPVGYFSLMVPNVAQVQQITKWVKRQAGVRDAQADVLQDVILNRIHFERGDLSAMNDVKKEQLSGLVKSAN